MVEFELTADNTQIALSELATKAFKALTECGLVAEGYAKLNAPVDTGALRNSISNKVVTESSGELSCYIGTNLKYAPFVEYGTGQYATEGGGRKTPWTYQDIHGNWYRTNGQPAQPFLRPAIADHIDEYQKIIETELKSEV